jgi:hypothetical protein
MYLTEGLAPAASTTGDDNIYISLFWGGQTPVSATFNAVPNSPTIQAGFAFNPVRMLTSKISVLMDITTLHTPDGNYVIAVTAQINDPQSKQPCTAAINADVTVSGSTVFVSSQGNQPAEAIWLSGINSPFLVSGQITASQYSNFDPTLDQNGYLTTLAFTLTGPAGTDGTGTLTIPKVLVQPGFVPQLFIDGVQVQLNSFTQDSTNFYITYTVHFSTHNVQLRFVQPASTTSIPLLGNAIYPAVAGVAAIAALLVIFVTRRRTASHPSQPIFVPTVGGGTQARYCRFCGNPISVQAAFCNQCGNKAR